MGVCADMDATLLTNLLNYCPLLKPNTWCSFMPGPFRMFLKLTLADFGILINF